MNIAEQTGRMVVVAKKICSDSKGKGNKNENLKSNVAMLSGGKDSTAMLLRMLEESCPVDLILFCDTGLEFPQMYEHLRKLEKYINQKNYMAESTP